MWWKRGFIILLTLNLLLLVGGLIVWNTFPLTSHSSSPAPIQNEKGQQNEASIQLVIGQDAINTYLTYAVSHEADLHKIIGRAHIEFASTWNGDVDVIVLGRTIPFHLVMVPVVVSGNLYLQIKQASMGVIPIPDSLLFPLMQRVQWPNWIRVDATHRVLQLNLTQRPQNPFGIRVVQYSDLTQQLTMQLTMSPNAILSQSNANHS